MFYGLTLVFLGVCTVTDFRKRQIWWPAAVLFVILSVIAHSIRGDMEWWNILAGIGIGFFLLIVSWVTKEAIGYGDGLTVAACGAALGFAAAFRILLLALVFASLWSGILLVRKKAGRKESFPFIPFLLAAQVCVMAAV